MTNLRRAGDGDLERIRLWRNHPDVRRVSFTTHEIGAEEHRAWFASVRDDETRRVLVYLHKDVPAGVVLFSDVTSAGSAEWAFYLDGDGLGRDLLAAWMRLEREAVDYAFEELGLEVLGGATLADNRQVLQLHRRFGFTEVRRYVREVDGVPREVVWTELRAADYRARKSRKQR
ncbi:GNAT family N-acetyltransferase [Amycolatopsis sp. NBC_01480]|uniref:GNAT family N-acetyltransferase n=1 Tax=Amycolatopsis sp. NBC_01480 TaxID=2903562 RepID=UPI002E2A006A|nr:GNAT family N-acetyltransferase [Amycolatopsis sp. NBC_01480]